MKRNGFSSILLTFGLMLFAALYMTITYPSLFNVVKNTKTVHTSMEGHIVMRNGLERVEAQLISNISYEGTIEYSDLGQVYQVSTKGIKEKGVQNHNLTTWEIWNQTGVTISLSGNTIEEERPSSYNFRIYYKDKKIKEGKGLSGTTTINIPSTYLYNKATGETHYGTYRLEIDVINMAVESMLDYNVQEFREVEIKDRDGLLWNVVIENRVVGGTKQIFFNGREVK